ncbi:MAG TPA: maleylpyruvate isomerase N-terminal domain-containing protein [Acidimicrobiia bacterium]|nr:maleylpyruvate isomerase N-terminal domain-containing protein [Acidimicrobiia bacterium]
MEFSQYLDSVRDNARQFVEAARRAGVDAPVPTCPDWTVADLARHQGRVFHWMSALVETKAQEVIDRTPFEEEAQGADDPLTFVAGGAEHALAVLGAVDPDTPVWNWFDGGPGPARFWFRRIAHETVVHRADAEAAAAAPAAALSRVEPAELAADGIDEFLAFLVLRARGGRPAGLSGSYHFHTTDVPGEWVVVFDGDDVTVRREHAKADVAVRGPASDLELFLYNRRGSEGLEVFGDPAAVAAWTEHIRF